MSVVVSANYRDRSQHNWLIRKAGDALENFELRDRVIVRNFRFCKALDGEEGFGCQMVAVGDVEEQDIDRSKLVKITFNGLHFREVETDHLVQAGRLLVLDETGMYYLPA